MYTVYILFDEMKTDEPGEMGRLTLQISVMNNPNLGWVVPNTFASSIQEIVQLGNSAKIRVIPIISGISYRCHPFIQNGQVADTCVVPWFQYLRMFPNHP